MADLTQSGGLKYPYILDVGLRFSSLPAQGQWARWRTPKREIVTMTRWTAPIETWYWEHFAKVLEDFASDFESD